MLGNDAPLLPREGAYFIWPEYSTPVHPRTALVMVVDERTRAHIALTCAVESRLPHLRLPGGKPVATRDEDALDSLLEQLHEHNQAMIPVRCFTLHRESSAHAEQQRTLLYEGRDTGLRVQATTLEAQFAIQPALYLLFLTHDSPYEEELQILLLDQHFRLLDGLRVGQWYTPGVLSGLRPEGEQRLSFEFFPDVRLLVEVHPEGALRLLRRLPPFASPLGRRLLSRHYLSISSTSAQAKP
jgi:hypothetical protein